MKEAAETNQIKILIVDDDEGMRTTLSDVLANCGYAVQAVESAAKALEAIQTGECSIVITDLKLPDMSGVEVMERVKEYNPEAATVMMTGYATLETAVQALNQGAFAYIVKPFHLDEVKAIVEKAVHQNWMAQENKRLIDELQITNKHLHQKKAQMEALTEKLTAQKEDLLSATEQLVRANRELKKADQTKSEFLANMSHELRTPLNAVLGFSEALLDQIAGPINEKQRRYVENIYSSGQMLLRLIDDVLDLSKIAVGKMELDKNQCLVQEMLMDVQRVVAPLASKKGISFAIASDLPRGALVFADQRKIQQVLLNLLSNAVKFTQDGGRVTLHVSQTSKETVWEVTDTGIGISKEDQNYLFREFKQLDSSTRKKHRGTGLGLVISKKLVELHGGRIWVESQEEKGSTFAISLPHLSQEEIAQQFIDCALKQSSEAKIPLVILGIRHEPHMEGISIPAGFDLRLRDVVESKLMRHVDKIVSCRGMVVLIGRNLRPTEIRHVIDILQKESGLEKRLDWAMVESSKDGESPQDLLERLYANLFQKERHKKVA